jgi:hypothetical protein
MSCILRSLDNPMLSGLALGLTSSKDGALSISPQFFPCCAGVGLSWDEVREGCRVCPLKSRLDRLQRLMKDYIRHFPQSSRYPFQLTPAWSNQILQELAGTFKGDRLPANVSYSSNQKAQPSLLWSKAFAAIWRFGIDVRFARITDFDPSELSALTRASDKPFAIFLDQVDKLWDPGILEAVEYVVQQTYNYRGFLWLDFVHQPALAQQSEEATSNVRLAVARRLAKIKDRHPLDLLSRDCLSRLQNISGIHHPSKGHMHA